MCLAVVCVWKASFLKSGHILRFVRVNNLVPIFFMSIPTMRYYNITIDETDATSIMGASLTAITCVYS